MVLAYRIKEISINRESFFRYVNKTVSSYRKDKAYYDYLELMNLRRKFILEKLFNRKDFFHLLYDTLISWDMNARTAKLVDFKDFVKTIKDCSKTINELDKFSIERIKDNELEFILDKIRLLFEKMTVMKTNSQIVGLSKTLHFLLPDLIMPVDGKFTLNFFYGYRKYRHYRIEEFEIFKEIFYEFYKITKIIRLDKSDISKSSWNQSIPKIIDNAIIGFIKRHNSDKTNKNEGRNITKSYNFLSGYSLESLKESKENEYYIYENWVAEKKAVIHRDICGNCNHGQGKHANICGEKNGKWHGPFKTYDKAKKFALNLDDRTVRDCKVCNP